MAENMHIPSSQPHDEEKLREIEDLLKEAQQTLDEVASIRKTLSEIRESLSTGDADLSGYQKKMDDWSAEGNNVARLELALDTGIPELVKKIFEGYERDLHRLKEIEKSLDGLDTTGFKKKENDIRENLKNPEEVILMLKHLIELEVEVRRKMEMNV